MVTTTPVYPHPAHHRLMLYLFKEPVKWQPTPKELDKASKVFQEAGGSWVRLHAGSIKDILLLRQTVTVGCKEGKFTKSSWGK